MNFAVAHRTYHCRVRLLSAKGRAFQAVGRGRSDFQRTGRSHIYNQITRTSQIARSLTWINRTGGPR